MKNIGQMMKQAQAMQQRMAELQTKISALQATGQSGGGMVSATVDGTGAVRGIKIDKSIVDPTDVEMLEDLLVAACSDAKSKMDAQIAEETQKAMGGFQLPPGFKMPF